MEIDPEPSSRTQVLRLQVQDPENNHASIVRHRVWFQPRKHRGCSDSHQVSSSSLHSRHQDVNLCLPLNRKPENRETFSPLCSGLAVEPTPAGSLAGLFLPLNLNLSLKSNEESSQRRLCSAYFQGFYVQE